MNQGPIPNTPDVIVHNPTVEQILAHYQKTGLPEDKSTLLKNLQHITIKEIVAGDVTAALLAELLHELAPHLLTTWLTSLKTPADIVEYRPIRGGGESAYVARKYYEAALRVLFPRRWSFIRTKLWQSEEADEIICEGRLEIRWGDFPEPQVLDATAGAEIKRKAPEIKETVWIEICEEARLTLQTAEDAKEELPRNLAMALKTIATVKKSHRSVLYDLLDTFKSTHNPGIVDTIVPKITKVLAELRDVQGEIISLGDDCKAAESYALKKAASKLGLFADVANGVWDTKEMRELWMRTRSNPETQRFEREQERRQAPKTNKKEVPAVESKVLPDEGCPKFEAATPEGRLNEFWLITRRTWKLTQIEVQDAAAKYLRLDPSVVSLEKLSGDAVAMQELLEVCYALFKAKGSNGGKKSKAALTKTQKPAQGVPDPRREELRKKYDLSKFPNADEGYLALFNRIVQEYGAPSDDALHEILIKYPIPLSRENLQDALVDIALLVTGKKE